jgi:hypothetical protein
MQNLQQCSTLPAHTLWQEGAATCLCLYRPGGYDLTHDLHKELREVANMANSLPPRTGALMDTS